MATLARIRIHPIKSLDGLEVLSVGIRPDGTLERDREYAFFGEDGKVLDATRVPELHRIRADYDLDAHTVRLRDGVEGEPVEFSLDHDEEGIAAWAGAALGRPVVFRRAREGNFTKDHTTSGPTLVSTASLVAVACWFPGLAVHNLRRRLRANLEVVGVPAFWEDGLYPAAPDETLRFRVGPVELLGSNGCRRCAAFTRDPDTGVAAEGFAETLSENRERTLPPWAHRERFDTFFSLSINTAPGAIDEGARITYRDPVLPL
jgi:uncharacterized protein YcbX